MTLKLGEHIQIGDVSPGTMGQYQLQLNVNCTYQQTTTFQGVARPAYRTAPIQVEMVVITVNSGYLINDHGNSRVEVGVLDNSIVHKTEQQPVSGTELKRMIGGGFFDSLKNVASSVLPLVRRVAAFVPHPVAQIWSKALEHEGYGHSGGARKHKKGGGHAEDYMLDADYRLRE